MLRFLEVRQNTQSYYNNAVMTYTTVSTKYQVVIPRDIYATAMQEKATLVTGDHHFEGLDQVVLIS